MFEWNVRDRDGGRRGKKVKSSGREVGKRVERAENNINLRKRGVIDEGNYEARKVCVCLAEREIANKNENIEIKIERARAAMQKRVGGRERETGMSVCKRGAAYGG